MSAITAQIHIDTSSSSSSAGEKPLPTTPIAFTQSSVTTLAPNTQLHIPLNTHQNANKPQTLDDLVDALDQTRTSLNQVLTSWKDWAGKEEVAGSAAKKGRDDEDQDEDEEEEEE